MGVKLFTQSWGLDLRADFPKYRFVKTWGETEKRKKRGALIVFAQ